jgi:hypothetical protein
VERFISWIDRCLRHWLNTTLAKAWDTWVSFVEWRREKRKIVQRWMQPMMVSAEVVEQGGSVEEHAKVQEGAAGDGQWCVWGNVGGSTSSADAAHDDEWGVLGEGSGSQGYRL